MIRKRSFACAVCMGALIVGVEWFGCTKNSSNPAEPNPPGVVAPTNLRAYSAGPTSVGLLWNLSTSESDQSFSNYMVRAKDPSGLVVAALSVAKGTPNVTVSSLSEGVIYTFVVRSVAGATESSDSASVQWSPARRYLTDSTNGPPIQVYELRSNTGASGLQFSSTAGAYAEVISLNAANPDRVLCDVYVDSVGGGAVCLKNIALLAGYPRNTFFSTVTRDASDLDDPESAPPDPSTYQQNRIDIPAVAASQSKILYARSGTDNKCVRILVQRNQATGLLYSGSGSDRYLVLQISYQNTPGNWFAKRAIH